MSKDELNKGLQLAERLFGSIVEEVPLPDDFREFTLAHIFGGIWQGEGLSVEERSLVTCTVLIALNREAEQRLHFVGAKNLGIPRARVEAAISHVAVYAGWPVAVSAFRILNEVWLSTEESLA